MPTSCASSRRRSTSSHYVFFTDPTYPFTGAHRRAPEGNGAFADVTLDCLGDRSRGWKPVGTDGEYEIAYVKLVDHFNRPERLQQRRPRDGLDAPFGVWVWGWGSEDTSTGWVSYGYPAGEGVLPINDVVIE